MILKEVITKYGWNNNSSTGIHAAMVEKIEKRLSKRLPEGQSVRLTALQEMAINDDNFRDNRTDKDTPPRHLIIQGATSAGKTLLSEISIIDVLSRYGKAIVLVPLKAMVRERTEHFKSDMEKHGFRVFGSSGDYIDHDEDIVNGNYNVAVIVYEKYFAMLSHRKCRMLENCDLLVVDELSMLSKDERGPKLEMALEMTRNRNPYTRIMCLATSDCSTEKISKWLCADDEENTPAYIIKSPLRPVGLDEYILKYSGNGKHRHIPGENEQDTENITTNDFTLDIPRYRDDMMESEKKEKALIAALRKIYFNNPKSKVLIFVATKRDTEKYSQMLLEQAGDIFCPVKTDETFEETLMKIKECDDEDDREKLENFLSHGIAYHNSSVSASLREIIEEEFQRTNSPVKAIVATETLTIGVNMPFDAMVMMDSRVPKGAERKQPLTNQEYRNYIGRAGRLGQSNAAGSTYLFVQDDSDFSFYWDSFYKPQLEIPSALTGKPETEKMPYFLSLFVDNAENDVLCEESIKALYEKSLSRVFEDGTKFKPEIILDDLYDSYLSDEHNVSLGRLQRKSKSFELTQFGESMAPYALSKDTCSDIYGYFLCGESRALPCGTTSEMIDSDCYLLEILYHVCRHKEIDACSSVQFPINDGKSDATEKTRKNLTKLFEEKTPDGDFVNKLWTNDTKAGGIYEVWKGTNLTQQDKKMQAAMRTVLMYYWTKGKTIDEIKNITGLKIQKGEMERLADLISFHIDAIYSCLQTAVTNDGMVLDDTAALSAFYCMQTRIKYGMERDLVAIANKHVHGLDRERILKFGSLAKEKGEAPIDLLRTASDRVIKKYMSVQQRNLLMQRIEKRYGAGYGSSNNFGILMEKLKKDLTTEFPSELENKLQVIFEWNGSDVAELVDTLYSILDYRVPGKNQSLFVNFNNFRALNARSFNCYRWTAQRIKDGEIFEEDIFVGVLPDSAATSDTDEIKDFFSSKKAENEGCTCILITSREPSSQQLEILKPYFDLAMSCCFFAATLAQAIGKQNLCSLTLYRFLTDAYGIFNSNTKIQLPLLNYLKIDSDTENQPVRLRILCSWDDDGYDAFDATELKNTLSHAQDISNYEVLPWGEELINIISDNNTMNECPIAIFVTREHIIHSKSLTKLLYELNQRKHQNCAVIFDSDEAEELWMSRNYDNGVHCLNWLTHNCHIPCIKATSVYDAVNGLKTLVNNFAHNGYLIGVSYAHYADTRESFPPSDEILKNDEEKISDLCEALKAKYGKQRILFDKYCPENFAGDGAQQKSLDKYAQCSFYLILCNYWTLNNDNCKKEIEVIKERCKNKNASCIYLTAGNSASRSIEGEFTASIDDKDFILNYIDEYLNKA